MSSTTTTWTTDTNTKSGSATTFTNTVSSLQLLGAQDEDAILKLFADEGDDNADQWRIVSKASNNKLNFMSYASGAWSNVLSLFGSGTAASVYAALPATSKLYLDGGTHTYIDESAADIMDFYAGGVHMLSLDDANTEVVINEGGADIDFRVESDDNTHMLFLDGGNNRIGIGMDTPLSQLHMQKAGGCEFRLSDSNQTSIIKTVERSGTSDLAFLTATSSTRMTILGGGNVGIGETVPTAKLHIDQSSASGAGPVLRLDQGDEDESFIDFIGTSASDDAANISSDTTSDSAKFGAIRVEINGVHKWIRIYDDHS